MLKVDMTRERMDFRNTREAVLSENIYPMPSRRGEDHTPGLDAHCVPSMKHGTLHIATTQAERVVKGPQLGLFYTP